MQLEFCEVVAQTKTSGKVSRGSVLGNHFSADGHHVDDPDREENYAQAAELEHA